ncbi:XrtY-associated glycosyltransferase XYAG1 [Pedobacter chitinilyticus]|uniref:Glycosyltransferase n=1 Tax=Pedobacter chitinilyticus TaxID=2233776 RepID=A0A3S3PHT3_9SPHI|nr:glycosyltransferase [Pedobacter chitinilyticus]RWU08616.1 glycosyltransferase [Pedobacter chitinilyticus]
MKIIQICAAYKPAYIYGGPTMSVSKLSEELVKAGQDVVVLATTANGKTELNVPSGLEQIVDGVKVFYFKRLTKDHTHFSPALFSFLRKLIVEEKKAGRKNELIIHIHAWWNLVSIFSCLVAKIHGVKVVLSPRGMLTNYSLNNRNSKLKDAIHFFLGKNLLKYCHIHATSEKEQEDILETCIPNNTNIIANFVELGDATPTSGSLTAAIPTESSTYQLLFLSRIEEKKGLELLFNALAKVNISWNLSIAGSGEISYLQHLYQLADQLNISSKIKWLGQADKNQKFELLAEHDLLVLSSHNENFANVVIESLSVGTPVLVSTEVGLADYVTKNNLGWVVPNDPDQLMVAIIKSFEDTQKRAQIRASAPSKIKQDFDETTLANKYISMYKHLLGKS